MIAADLRVREPGGPLLLEPVGLADRGVEIDREGSHARTRAGCPGPGDEFAADPVELPDVAPAEAPQEGPQGRRCLHPEAQHPLRPARPERVRVGDAVAPGEGGHDERQELVAGVRPAGLGAEVEVLVNERLQAHVLGQRRRQEEPRVGHQTIVVEGRVKAIQAVR